MLEGFAKVLEVLVSKISRKAVVIALAMILVYMLAATPNISSLIFAIIVISSLAVFFTILQWIIDYYGRAKDKKK